ncbi:DUF2399 domain-containing protein [Myxococcus xanthus]|uniref:DUF2399 domain-containing protein n=1 Tax=Myxococcus xanthus TaxID=34 RepID=A0A7Y4MSH3_MYXXA|nr:DUF2399 domain-containing protein [Myxococcus xanthus]NOJ81071.1 DUF2399 domain-containing protein [Myxococcus xanthus]NOJ88673.1 DUF2399 domain-containing protein [Myxococcus xanthus]
MTASELDERQVEQFERRLLADGAVRVGEQELWRALANVFPHRTPGPAERRLLLDALRSIETRGSIRLPPEHGKRWDRSMDPAVPTSVDIVRERSMPSDFSWRTFPWHQNLHWVVQCRNLSTQQVEFLRRVHDGFVNGMFSEPAPLKYRSLQLTGDEKMLASLATTSLFGPSRLTLELLACLPDALPLAWEAVGDGGRMLIFENAGPFAVARRVLAELEARQYDLVAYGGGRSLLAALGHLKTIERPVQSIHYVGDLDDAGLDIAFAARKCAKELGLPALLAADELHRQMLLAAEAFGYSLGWPSQERFSNSARERSLDIISPSLRNQVHNLLRAGRRIPEEVLGPEEFRAAWSILPR